MSRRIMVVGDTNDIGQHWPLVFQAAKRHGVSGVYQLGDTGYTERDEAGRMQLAGLSVLSLAYGIPVAFVDGNHESHAELWDRYWAAARSPEGFWELRPNVFYIPRGLAWTVEGVRFLGLGGAYSIDKAERLRIEQETGRPGSMWSPDEELTDDDVAKAKAQGKVDIMLTHDKPRGSNPGPYFTSEPACWPNQDKVSDVMQTAMPSLLLHGHLHFPYRDHVRVGSEGDWCEVISLESDELGSRSRPYEPPNSWLVLELNKGNYKIVVTPPALAEV